MPCGSWTQGTQEFNETGSGAAASRQQPILCPKPAYPSQKNCALETNGKKVDNKNDFFYVVSTFSETP